MNHIIKSRSSFVWLVVTSYLVWDGWFCFGLIDVLVLTPFVCDDAGHHKIGGINESDVLERVLATCWISGLLLFANSHLPLC